MRACTTVHVAIVFIFKMVLHINTFSFTHPCLFPFPPTLDCVMLSPGIVKPTRLAEDGHKLLEQTFSQMPPAATTEYRDMINAFTQFQIEEPGTHVSEVSIRGYVYIMRV